MTLSFSHLIAYLASLIVLVAGDLLWLGYLMRGFYTEKIGHLMSGTVNWPPALLFYAIYPAGLLYFAVYPNLAAGLTKVALNAFMFGVLAYAVYDLTNHATLKNWPLAVTLYDLAWGGVLTMLTGLAAYAVHRYLMA